MDKKSIDIDEEINYIQTWTADKNQNKFDEKEIMNFKSFFNQLDQDKDGVLSKAEFKVFLQERGVDSRFLDAIYYIFDKSKPTSVNPIKEVKDLTQIKRQYENQTPTKPKQEPKTQEKDNSQQENSTNETKSNEKNEENSSNTNKTNEEEEEEEEEERAEIPQKHEEIKVNEEEKENKEKIEEEKPKIQVSKSFSRPFSAI